MPIPSIASYAMPTAAELTVGPAAWRPDPARAALLVHDMQGYFLDFFPPDRSPTTELLTNVARLKAAAAACGMPVIHTAQPGRMTRSARGLLHDLWGPGMTDEPRARDIVPAVAPQPGDAVLVKHRYSAFHRTTLAADLAAAGRDQLVVCGVFAHIGCLLTAADAYAHDVEPFLVADAVADFSAEEHRMALRYAARRCAATPTTDQVLAEL
ncbi:isochorismatase family protein [Cryptosporangium aurantiacum]|uniref:Bifunctional isochorismate lyase / aryl carrier protein n=1 Tax=Cryptosporangium aurantiacum TaxID=134849 RepID=A0A1M7KXR9_9ACTN|nr:isochorismatase family protein [Cryptosporangium aurantiacum]SHM70413.1 bifunctional isochorismate lyase / aryl carrier protein [Cryptosporangium aurantiacum]